MLSRLGVSLCIAVPLLIGGVANAVPVDITISGETYLFIVDKNGDGPGPGDCQFEGTLDPPNLATGSLTLTSTQDLLNALFGCGGTTIGSIYFDEDDSSHFLGTDVASTTYAPSAIPAPPGMLTPFTDTGRFEFVHEFGGAPPPFAFPVVFNQILLEVPLGSVTAAINLCNAAGPAGVFDIGATSILVPFSFYPDAESPTHLKMPSFPYSLEAGGTALLDVYIPATGHKIVAALADSPDEPFAVLDFDALGACPTRTRAPTLTEVGIAALLAAILVSEAWRLGRRESFYRGLPLP